jgi:hypothetical protein
LASLSTEAKQIFCQRTDTLKHLTQNLVICYNVTLKNGNCQTTGTLINKDDRYKLNQQICEFYWDLFLIPWCTYLLTYWCTYLNIKTPTKWTVLRVLYTSKRTYFPIYTSRCYTSRWTSMLPSSLFIHPDGIHADIHISILIDPDVPTF